jgi:hypothetical protein
MLGRLLNRLTAWNAARDTRPEFVKKSQARIWRITVLAIAAILGAGLALLAFIGKNDTLNRLAGDETCLRSVVAAQSTRSNVLGGLNARLKTADQSRQNWNTIEQQLFARAFSHRPLSAAVLRREFARANRGYLRADARYRRLSTLYDRASQAHPVPQLDCTAGQLNRPAPTVTATTTMHATATKTTHTTIHAPPRVVIRTRVVTRHAVATRTAPAPGSGKHHRHRPRR